MLLDKFSSQIVNCSKFFFQPNEGESNLEKHQQFLQVHCSPISNDQSLTSGSQVIVRHGDSFKLGKIIQVPDIYEKEFIVFLRDYGDILPFNRSDFYSVNDQEMERNIFELPPQCFECRLSEVKVPAFNSNSEWSEQTKEEFETFIANKRITIDVYSFVDRIASVRVFASAYGRRSCLNEYLILNGFALRTDESYPSMIDHINRDKSEARDSGKIKNEMNDEYVEIPPEYEDCLVESVTLDGPFSPLDSSSRLKKLSRDSVDNISIVPTSVNHVLIDPFPNDGVTKILVAAAMSKQGEDRVMLHNTMIMPHSPEMACLLALLFSPTAELRLSSDKTRFSSILVGLGCDGSRKSHFGEHDCLLHVDVALDNQDIDNINEIRRKMSLVMRSDLRIKFERNRNKLPDISRMIHDLIAKERTPLGVIYERQDWEWSPKAANEYKEVKDAYPQIHCERLKTLSENSRRDLKRHAEEMERKAETNSRNELIFCRLCEEQIETLQELQIHVLKRMHKDNFIKLRCESNQGIF